MAKVYLDKIDSIRLKKVQKMPLLLLFDKNKVDFLHIILEPRCHSNGGKTNQKLKYLQFSLECKQEYKFFLMT